MLCTLTIKTNIKDFYPHDCQELFLLPVAFSPSRPCPFLFVPLFSFCSVSCVSPSYDRCSHVIPSSGVPVAEQCTAHLEHTGTFSLPQVPPNHSRRLIFARTKRKSLAVKQRRGGIFTWVLFMPFVPPPAVRIAHVFPSLSLTAQLICFHLRCSAELCEQLWKPTRVLACFMKKSGKMEGKGII